MELAELKLISASNIINLRTRAGMTQAELGAVLNYSDKTISKWERGEAIPDAYVLLKLAEIFHVSVDFLLSSHDSWELPEEKEKSQEPRYSINVIMTITILGIMTAALATFIVCWICGMIEWRIFLVGLTVSTIVFLVLDCVFKQARHLKLALVLLIISIFVLAYCIFLAINPWQVFLLLVPALALAILSTYVSVEQDRGRLRRKKKDKKEKEERE